MDNSIKIGFTGNRYGLTDEQKNQIITILDNYENIIVSHGDCVGSDTDFHNLCVDYRNTHKNKNIRIDIYPPNNPILRAFNQGDVLMDEQPYLQRNANIVENSMILIACPIDKNNEITRSGTWSTIRKARKLKREIFIL